MCIAIERHAVGAEREKFLNAFRDAVGRLMGKAIEDVGVEAVDTARAKLGDGVAGQLEALATADAFLNLGIEILNTDRGAVHTRLC